MLTNLNVLFVVGPIHMSTQQSHFITLCDTTNGLKDLASPGVSAKATHEATMIPVSCSQFVSRTP